MTGVHCNNNRKSLTFPTIYKAPPSFLQPHMKNSAVIGAINLIGFKLDPICEPSQPRLCSTAPTTTPDVFFPSCNIYGEGTKLSTYGPCYSWLIHRTDIVCIIAPSSIIPCGLFFFWAMPTWQADLKQADHKACFSGKKLFKVGSVSYDMYPSGEPTWAHVVLT